ncbi:glycosyltransferase [Pseudomonas sp. 22526]|uniref:glycosyltransferase n=1 Tax=Pseudomonas sp. 22526 TaxID=3453937 RepID=UPI003F828C3B
MPQKRILVIGKAPPVQGGVSINTYEVALELVTAGYQVDLLSNRQEVAAGYRQVGVNDQGRAGLNFIDIEPLTGFFHVPYSPLFFERLAGKSLALLQDRDYSLIVGWYLFPYGAVASYISTVSGIPYVLLHAGSDINRLANHSSLKHMVARDLQNASAIIAPNNSAVTERLMSFGTSHENIKHYGGGAQFLKHHAVPGRTLDQLVISLRSLVSEEAPWFNWDLINSPAALDFSIDKQVVCLYGKASQSKRIKEVVEEVDKVSSEVDFSVIMILAGELEELKGIYTLTRTLRSAATRIFFLPPLSVSLLHEVLDVCDVGICIEESFQVDSHLSRRPREMMCFSVIPIVSKDFLSLPYYRDTLINSENCLVIDSVSCLSNTLYLLLTDHQLLSHLRRGVVLTSQYVESKMAECNPIAVAIGQCAESVGNE